MKPELDLRLYALIDPEHCGGRASADVAVSAVRGGATLLQYRDKRHTTHRQIELVRAILNAAAPSGVPVLVNDRVDVALASGAHGVHLGRDDMTLADARRLMGSDAVIGGTVHFVEEADAIEPDLVDYVGLGPVFATSSKTANDPALGASGLASLLGYWRRHAPNVPACAIAGIAPVNAAEVLATGIDGIAVISAIGMAADVEAAARHLRQIVESATSRGRAA